MIDDGENVLRAAGVKGMRIWRSSGGYYIRHADADFIKKIDAVVISCCNTYDVGKTQWGLRGGYGNLYNSFASHNLVATWLCACHKQLLHFSQEVISPAM